jgi:Mrp family chromosome partitioning ATPase
MFRKQPQSPVTGRPSDLTPTTEVAIQLTAQRSEAVYHLPHELVHSLRHMVTKLNRSHKVPTNLSIVSALRQEGVSFVAQSLATIMAHDLSQRICLVDLNWWWPSAPMRELARHYPGLLPLLHGEINWDTAVAPTNHPHLSILPAGNVLATQRPVIARSDRLQMLIAELGQHFDHLIFDVPAILTTSDAIPLASLGHACCVVVQQGISSRTTVKRATAEIDHLPLLGVVMNRVQVATPPWLLKWVPQD